MTQRRPMVRPLAWHFQRHQDRDRAVLEAFRKGGYPMREIGKHIWLLYSTISRIISLVEHQQGKA